MNKSELHKNYPRIAFAFEKVLYDPKYDKKYRFMRYNYGKPERGISFEKIFEVLNENMFIIRLDNRKWYEVW